MGHVLSFLFVNSVVNMSTILDDTSIEQTLHTLSYDDGSRVSYEYYIMSCPIR